MTAVDQVERDRLARIWVAMVLSPRVEIAEALLRSESVPLNQIGRIWAARLAVDPPITSPRVTLADFATVPLEYDPFPIGGRP